jgi:hypothetical protein
MECGQLLLAVALQYRGIRTHFRSSEPHILLKCGHRVQEL